MTGPNFYTIDFDREIVLQGKSTTFVTIARNDSAGVTGGTGDVFVMIMPNSRTFNAYYSGTGVTGGTAGVISLSNQSDTVAPNTLSFNNIDAGMVLKNSLDYYAPGSTGALLKEYQVAAVNQYQSGYNVTLGPTASIADFDVSPPVWNPDNIMHFGHWDDTSSSSWLLNGKSFAMYENIAYTTPIPSQENLIGLPNVFDGSIQQFSVDNRLYGTGYVGRERPGWANIKYDPAVPNASITIRIDYDGETDSHIKLNFLIWKKAGGDTVRISQFDSPLYDRQGYTGPNNPTTSYINVPYGAKSGTTGNAISQYVDYQELHVFGYMPTSLRTSREKWQNDYVAETKIYDDRSSYSLLKTNPKISGNVKITLDSNGDLWLNSIDANNELSDSAYKKFSISSKSTYAKDLYTFFKNGTTPATTVFDLYQVDNQYENTKRNLYEQYDNFYNYGVEQLKNRYYDESFSFFAPLWLRKNVPDYFIIFRLDHPLSAASYANVVNNPDKFLEFFTESRIIKTFDMREKSKLGAYLRKIVNDQRFKERPLDVSFDTDVATTWNGISYKDGSMSGKGEFLSDYWTKDRPIIELEEYITGGFERNGVIGTNLVNLEFLFNDEEATLYTINRYFGLYVTENQLANFQIAPDVLAKITDQTPSPRAGVDGEPYSTKTFQQTNPNGIQLPVNYYHNPPLGVNNTNVPSYQGDVVGKLPLSSMVDDPLRIFYVKDRNDEFKRIKQLVEAEYGNPGTDDYKRVTQLTLFENTEDISKYAGANQITSQFTATLLNEGNSQLRLHLALNGEDKVFADDETLELTVNQFNHELRLHTYYLRLIAQLSTYVTFEVFKDQEVQRLSTSFTMPDIGFDYAGLYVDDVNVFSINQQVYITKAGYFIVSAIDLFAGQISITNIGNPINATGGATISDSELLSVTGPTYVATYTTSPNTNELSIDPLLTIIIDTDPGTFSDDTSYRIEVKDTAINIYDLVGTGDRINAKLAPASQQYRWRMIANRTGLRPGKSWDYPVEDINGYDYITHFSNEGTASQVAQSLASAVNSFDNRPCDAIAYDEVVYLKSRILGSSGNNVQLTRKMITGESNIYNLGFYEAGNVSVEHEATVLNLPGTDVLSYPITVNFLNKIGTYGTSYTYFRFKKLLTGYYAEISVNVDPTTAATAATTGSATYYITAPSDNIFTDPRIPYSIDLTLVPDGIFVEYVVKTVIGPETITQMFVGGDDRNRNRAKLTFGDSERYYSDRRKTVTANTSIGSKLVSNVNLTGLYIGGSVVGNGVASSSFVTAINHSANSIEISKPATATLTNVNLVIGDLSIINNTEIKDQWYQTKKGLYSPVKGWNVQGKFVYSLPYLDEPTYNAKDKLSDFTGIGAYSIIQVQDETQEFYQTLDKRIVAYDLYRPVIGIFSIYPIKEFDFDFYFSDYSYSPLIEAFRYYFKETVKAGESVILPSDENWYVSCSETVPYTIKIEGLNPITNQWNFLTNVDTGNDSPNLIMNTYYPFYVYDALENPLRDIDPATYSIGGSGLRNYMSRKISMNNGVEVVEASPLQYRLTFIYAGSNEITFTITKNDYKEDRDLLKFQGFAALEDINTQEDAENFRDLINQDKYVEAFLSQSLKSEYDRLRENYNKSYAVKSKVVPYINKWAQEGTDARDNYYRLNLSRAFGISNFSPDANVNFAEASLLTNEFPYLDTVPKDYPDESLEGSRSYMFAKLTDVAKDSSTWYDLLTSNDNDDWFTKYFAIGYPTERNSLNQLVPKSRDERFTFFTYNDGVKRSQTLFRGAKIQILDLNELTVPPSEVLGSSKYNDYKFAAIAQIVPYTQYAKEKPVSIEIVKNDTHKSIVMIITVHLQDYRIQSGLYDYLFFYAVNDQLKNYGQQQVSLVNTTSPFNPAGISYHDAIGITDFMPYGKNGGDVFDPTSYTDMSIMRPRQGFFGGGYLELGDTLLGGVSLEPIKPTLNGNILTFDFTSVDPTYSFSILDEIIPTLDNYKNKTNVYSSLGNLRIQPASLTQDGSLYKLLNVTQYIYSGGNKIIQLINRQDSRLTIDKFLPSQVTFSSTPKPILTYQIVNYAPANFNINQYLVNKTGIPPLPNTVETFNIKGGTSAYTHIKNLLTYASITDLINNDSAAIEYFKLSNGVKTAATDYRLRFIEADQIIKTGVLAYVNDEDKPIEYIGSANIGYNIVDTNQNEVVYRHRGSYEPKATDILSFWVREDQSFTSHFGTDYLLSNTHFNNVSPLSGLVRNYSINKVSDAEILKISKSSAYKSFYPILNEVAIDYKDSFVLDSTWDKAYYQKYYDLKNWNAVNGVEEMQEFKSFMGSKAMNVSNTQQLETFNTDELTYTVIQPAQVVGVKQLSTKTTQFTDVTGNTTPILSINIDVKTRFLRKMLEDISSPEFFDEFAWMQTLGISDLDSYSAVDISRLKTEYLTKNIIPLYQIDQVNLYAISKEGIPIVDTTLSSAQKIGGGYRIDKDCKVTNTDTFAINITKQLDTKKPLGYSVEVILKRI